jgi:hypothetical protein
LRTLAGRSLVVQLSLLAFSTTALLYERLCILDRLCRGCLGEHASLGLVKPFDCPYYVPCSLSGHKDQQCYVYALIVGGLLCSRHVRLILFLSAHAFGRPHDLDASSILKLAILNTHSLPVGQTILRSALSGGSSDPLSFFEVPLYARKKIIVVINALGGHQIRLLDELCWVALP